MNSILKDQETTSHATDHTIKPIIAVV